MSDFEGGPDDSTADSSRDDDAASSGGQVSEVQKMDPQDADTPISDSQGVAGQPDAESSDVQEGPAGPNARIDRESQQEGLDR